MRSPVLLEAPGEAKRAPYPRHRLVDGSKVELQPGGLLWLRRDDGTEALLRGPGRFEFFVDDLKLYAGLCFLAAPEDSVALVSTPAGSLRLAGARVSLEVTQGSTSAYVLRGEVTHVSGERAKVGERLILDGETARVVPEVVWQDWTGGLATTDRSPSPSPFGLGTVGARPPGDTGAPREPLSIQRVDVNVRIDGEFAVTEVDQVFFNASSETVEGVYRFRTPPGASLLRFGVDRGERLVWGRIRERAAAAAQYQENVYEGSSEDPALLEWRGPGQYHARLYPIEAGAARRVVVRYSEWLPRSGDRSERRLYVYPMAAEGAEASLPRIEELNATFDLKKAGALQVRSGMKGVKIDSELVVRARDFIPRADLAVELFDKGQDQLRGYRAAHAPDVEALAPEERASAKQTAADEADYLLLPLPSESTQPRERGLDLVIVIDSSAATHGSSLALASSAARALLEHLNAPDRAAIWSGADGLRPLLAGVTTLQPVTDAFRSAALRNLATLKPGGATDLGAMMSHAGSLLNPERPGAVVYIGDGAPTVGERSLHALSEKLETLPHPFRVFALGTGDRANMQVLEGLVNGGFAERLTDRHTGARVALRLLEDLERPSLLGLRVELGPQVERVYPRGVAPRVGQASLFVGRLRGPSPVEARLLGPGLDKTSPLVVQKLDDDGDLRLRWAGGRLRELLDERAGRAALVDLGMRYGLLSPVTSFYVPTARELDAEDGRIASSRKEAEEERDVRQRSANDEGGTGTRAKGEKGPMGNATAPSNNKRYAVKGPSDSRSDALEEAKEFGMIGILGQSSGGPAEGGGGKGEGIGLGAVGKLGHGAGTGAGQGFGAGHGRLGGSHRTRAPAVRMGAAIVSGKFPAEVARRIVRQNFGRFRLCYERALANNPNLQGRVVTRFIIDAQGSVSSVGDAGSSLPNESARGCVRRAYYGMSFPRPEGGAITVVVPVSFAPGGGGGASRPNLHEAEREAPPTPAKPSAVRVVAELSGVPARCGLAAELPLAERAVLWAERLRATGGDPGRVASVYREALERCEAADFRSRARLLSMLLDTVSSVTRRVGLWRILFHDSPARDVLYRGILARVDSASELSELHSALGLRQIDDDALTDLLKKARGASERVEVLSRLRVTWPDDLALAILLLEALEDAKRLDAGRELARELRVRSDVSAKVRTAVGEFYLRAAEVAGNDEAGRAQRERDLVEAKHSFGEIVEFAPDDPVARRRLGDLLSAHGWFDEARRQYETLAQLLPEDPSVWFLIARAAQGQGRLQEALQWLDKAAAARDPDSRTGPSDVARMTMAAYVARGRMAALAEGDTEDEGVLKQRALRIQRRGVGETHETKGTARVALTWTHPDFHPSLWSNARGSAMPVAGGDMTLGVLGESLPVDETSFVEVRIDEQALDTIARFGTSAELTVVFDALEPDERIVTVPVRFERGGSARLRFRLRGKEVTGG